MKQRVYFTGVYDANVLSRAAKTIDEWACYSVAKQYTGNHVGYKFFIRIVMVYSDDVKFLHSLFGGYYNVQVKDNGVVLYWWNVQDGRAIEILRLLNDRLVAKKEMVGLMFELRKLISRGSFRKLKPEQKEARENLFNKIREHQKKQQIWVKNEDGTYCLKE